MHTMTRLVQLKYLGDGTVETLEMWAEPRVAQRFMARGLTVTLHDADPVTGELAHVEYVTV